MKVVCIDNHRETDILSVGRTYQVLAQKSEPAALVQVRDDEGRLTWFAAERFRETDGAVSTFRVEKNLEDPETGGYFAYLAEDWDGWPAGHRDELLRGFGHTPRQAIACLCAVLDETEGQTWGREPQQFV